MMVLLAGMAMAGPATWEAEQVLVGVHNSFGSRLAVGDVDCDGAADLLAASHLADGDEGEQQGHVALFLGVSGGVAGADGFDTRWFKEWWGSVSGQRGSAVAVGDVNGDGCADVAIGEPNANELRGGWSLYLGRSGGMEHDPFVDLAGVAPGDQTGTALLLSPDLFGRSAGGFAHANSGENDQGGLVIVMDCAALDASAEPADTPPPPADLVLGDDLTRFGAAVASADLDGDGVDELVVAASGWDNSRGRLYMLEEDQLTSERVGDMDGVAQGHGTEAGSYLGQFIATLGDVDGDGREEFGACAPSAHSGRGQLQVWGLEDGALVAQQTLDGPEDGEKFCAALLGDLDLDSDGWPDLVVSVQSHRQAWVYYGDGTGFEGPVAVLAGGGGLAAVGDLDSDGHDDFVSGVYGLGQVGTFYGRRDWDRDGAGDEEDCDKYDPEVGQQGTWFRDADEDGFGDPSWPQLDCVQPEGTVEDATDCDDADAAVFPGGEERVGDGVDGNCDGVELCRVDRDGDGHADPEAEPVPSDDHACTQPGLADGAVPADDCDDLAETIHPGATDWPDDGRDQDCDGQDAASAPIAGEFRSVCGWGCGGSQAGLLLLPLLAVRRRS